MTDPVIRDAIKLRDKLLDVAKELDMQARTMVALNKPSAGIELARIDAETCRRAALMMQKLGGEVTRLRLGIGHLYYGRMTRHDLNEMATNWNTPEPTLDDLPKL